MPFTYLNPPILALDPFYFGGNVSEAAPTSGTWQTLAVNQGTRYGTDYPFINPSADIQLLLGDMFLAYEDEDCAFELPFKVSWMYGFGTVANGPILGYDPPTHNLDLVITDANDAVVFDSTKADEFTQSAWGEGLETASWIGDNGTLRVTRHTGWPEWYTGGALNQFIEPTNGIISPRTYMRMPRRVKSLRVGLQQMDGDIVLSEGFNIRLTPVEIEAEDLVDGGRLRKQLEIRATPGDGLGRQPGCEDADLVLKRINGVEATEGGDFKLQPVGCYWYKRPADIVSEVSPRTAQLASPDLSVSGAAYGVDLTQILPFSNIDTQANLRLAMENETSMMQLLNDCSPCCECDDYVVTYRALSRVYNKYLSLGDRAEDVRDQHTANIARWESQLACRLANPLRLTISAQLGGKIAIGAAHCNLTQCCVGPVLLRLTFEAFEDSAVMSPDPELSTDCVKTKRKGSDTNYEEVDFIFAGAYPIYDVEFDFSDPQATSNFRTLLTMAEAAENQGMRVTLSVHMNPTAAEEGKFCPLPEASSIEVPAEVEALWASNPPAYPVRGLIQKTIGINPNESCCS